MPNVAIAILNWNGKKHLQEFLPSVIAHSTGFDIYVIDNGSTDDSLQYIHDQFPQIKTISLPINLGFCDGYNQGLAQIESDYYVILNSDVEVTQNWLKAPIELLENNIDIAACQPKILSYNDKNMLEYAGAAGGYLDSYGYPFCRGRIFNDLEPDSDKWNDTREVFWATGAALIIRSSVFQEVGGFESLFFAHMEEIDLCWRIRNRGFRIYYCGQSTVYHLGGGTLNKTSPQKTYLNFRNGLGLLYRNLPAHQLFYKIPIRLALDGVAGLYFIKYKDYKGCWAILRAHFAFYRMIPKLNRPKRIYSNHTGILKGLIIWKYFIQKKKFFRMIENQIS